MGGYRGWKARYPWFYKAEMAEVQEILAEVIPPLFVGLLCAFKTFGPFTITQNIYGLLPKSKRKPLFPLVKEDEVRRWAPVLMIGPLPVALLALVVVSVGQMTFFIGDYKSDACRQLNSRAVPGSLGFTIGLAYMFIFVFFWSYMAFTYHLEFTFRKREFKLCVVRPFDTLGHLIACYLDLFLVGVGIMASHTMEVAAAFGECEAYGLVGYCVVVVALFWIETCVVMKNVLKAGFIKEEQGMSLAQSLAAKAKKKADDEARKKAEEEGLLPPEDGEGDDDDKEAANEDAMAAANKEKNAAAIKEAQGAVPLSMQADATESLGMQAVREQFMVIGNMDEISSADVEELLLNLRIRLNEKDVDEVKEKLDLEGIITFDLFYEWYKEYYAKKRGEGTDGPVDKSKKKNEPKEKKSWLGGKKKKGDAYSPGSPDKGDAPKDKDKDDKGGGGGKSKFSFGGKSKKTAPSS